MKLLLENWKRHLAEQDIKGAFDDIADAVEDASKDDEKQAEEFVDSMDGLRDVIEQLKQENEELMKKLEDYQMENERLRGDLSSRSQETISLSRTTDES